jgi:hypothetical protein
MTVPFEGGCRRRAVRYRVTEEPATVIHCHCRDCQYASGGACTTVLVVATASVTIEGAPASFVAKADSGTEVHRLFCQRCGSPLFAKNSATPTLLGIKAATLDDPTWLRPAAHIWTASAVPWARLDDDLTKFARNFGSS